jgi:hypothetical protein
MKRLKATALGSILGGTLVHLAVLTVIQIEPPVSREPFEASSEVRYVGNLDREVAPAILQQAALFDSAPLFMPTRWNPASEVSEVASLREATEIFDRFPAELRLPRRRPGFPGQALATTGGSGPELPGGPAFVLGRFGRQTIDPEVALSPGATLAIRRLDAEGGLDRSGGPIPAALQALSPPALWTPAQFYLQITEGVPVGLPVLAQSSGFADWDKAIQGFVSSLGFYRQLEDGYYHLWVYP